MPPLQTPSWWRTWLWRLSACAGLIAVSGCPVAKTPIQRAIAYLADSQSKHDSHIPGRVDYAGNWPQVFHFKKVPGYRIPDVSPFVVVFAHHALAAINPETQSLLNLSDADVSAAQESRKRAVACLRRFASRIDSFDAGAFGFWPYDADPRPADSPLEQTLLNLLKGPVLGGDRTPINLSYFPSELAVPADADVTATVYAALLDDESLDGGTGAAYSVDALFGNNRHVGGVPLRLTPNWLPANSGAYLTWFMNADGEQFGNDVDLVVNANVLYALARYGMSNAEGFADTVAVIDSAVADELHQTNWEDISLYYPDSYVFHYCISRAYAEGPVPALQPAVRQLADEILDDARRSDDGTAFWDKGNPDLNTAFALVTLLNAGIVSPLIDDGIAYLERRQNPVTGAWDEAPFFIARADSGIVIEWESAPLTTAIALEALCKARVRESR